MSTSVILGVHHTWSTEVHKRAKAYALKRRVLGLHLSKFRVPQSYVLWNAHPGKKEDILTPCTLPQNNHKSPPLVHTFFGEKFVGVRGGSGFTWEQPW